MIYSWSKAFQLERARRQMAENKANMAKNNFGSDLPASSLSCCSVIEKNDIFLLLFRPSNQVATSAIFANSH